MVHLGRGLRYNVIMTTKRGGGGYNGERPKYSRQKTFREALG